MQAQLFEPIQQGTVIPEELISKLVKPYTEIELSKSDIELLGYQYSPIGHIREFPNGTEIMKLFEPRLKLSRNNSVEIANNWAYRTKHNPNTISFVVPPLEFHIKKPIGTSFNYPELGDLHKYVKQTEPTMLSPGVGYYYVEDRELPISIREAAEKLGTEFIEGFR